MDSLASEHLIGVWALGGAAGGLSNGLQQVRALPLQLSPWKTDPSCGQDPQEPLWPAVPHTQLGEEVEENQLSYLLELPGWAGCK